MTLAPDLAPNRYCAAKPPLPWQTGMLPNQQLRIFIAVTLSPMAVGDGVETFGSKSADKAETAMMELSTVKGICPNPTSTPF